MRVYRQSGKLVEKYDVIRTNRKGGGGEYPTQDGFGWTNGVMRKLESLYPPPDARCQRTPTSHRALCGCARQPPSRSVSTVALQERIMAHIPGVPPTRRERQRRALRP